jgi:hypothetical protein
MRRLEPAEEVASHVPESNSVRFYDWLSNQE